MRERWNSRKWIVRRRLVMLGVYMFGAYFLLMYSNINGWTRFDWLVG